MEVNDLRSIDLEAGAGEGDVLKGTVNIFGTFYHMFAVRVKEDERTNEQVAANDPLERLESLYRYDEPNGAYETTDVGSLGYPGDYVVWFVPFG